MADRDILGAEIDLTIVGGKDLVAKDGGGLFSKSKSSDPYVRVVYVGHEYGRTEVVEKNLSPSALSGLDPTTCGLHVPELTRSRPSLAAWNH